MAQTGFTPIQIYSSSTAAAAPVAGNLTNSTLGSELAINITDGKLFYKDNAGNIQVIGWRTVPTTAGGTGLTTYAAGDTLFYAAGTTLSKLAIGASTTVLTSSGTAPQWTAQSSLSVGTASNLLSNATTGVMQITGPGTGTTRVMTIPNANFTAARTDAAQTFTGDQTFGTILATTFDTNVAAAGVTLAGTTLSADGTNTNIDINITPKGSGKTQFTNMTRTTLSEGVMQEFFSTSTTIFTGSQIAKTDVYGSDGGAAIIAYQDWRSANNHSTNSRDMSLYIGLANAVTQTAVDRLFILSSGSIRPSSDNAASLGAAGNRWSEVFAGNGTINTSDAREKTDVRQLNVQEIAAAKDLCKEIGVFKFLSSVAKKGNDARDHIGLTVQRAIEIMQSHGLNPMNYGFICYDQWDDIVHKAATDTQDAVVQPAGDRYSFRPDQLALFICRGLEERIAALENK